MGEDTVVRFVSGSAESEAASCIYIAYGGGPLQMDFLFSEFFDRIEVEATRDTRYSDPSYLAARFLVFVSMYSYDDDGGGREQFSLDFTGAAIIRDQPLQAARLGWNIYTVLCKGSQVALPGKVVRPEVMFHDVLLVQGDVAGDDTQVVWQNLVPLLQAVNNIKEK